MTQSLFQIHQFKRYYRNLEPLLKTRQMQAYTMVILSLFTLSFFGVFAIRPTLRTIASLQRKIDDNNEVNQKLEDKINALIAAQEEYKRVEPNLQLIYSLLPEKPEFPSLLRRIENLAIVNEATLSSIQFDPLVLYGTETNPTANDANAIPTESDTSISTPVFFILAFGGDYEHLVNLLADLTKLDRLISISSVSLTLTDKTKLSTLNVTVAAQAYYYQLTL